MTNFTELFATTLNATLEKMVADAVAQQSSLIADMQETIRVLEATVSRLEDSVQDEDEIIRIVDNAVDNLDLDDQIRNAVDLTGLLDEPEFERAVRRVISEALG